MAIVPGDSSAPLSQPVSVSALVNLTGVVSGAALMGAQSSGDHDRLGGARASVKLPISRPINRPRPNLNSAPKPQSKSSPKMSLMRGRVHEILGPGADGFVLAVLRATTGAIFWTGREGRIASLCPLAMPAFFDPGRLITTSCISRKEVLWSAEQALRSRGADVVVIELNQGPDLKESRRLQLASEAGRTLGLIIIGRGAQSSAAQTRWFAKGVDGDLWHWELVKNKSGHRGSWTVNPQDVIKGAQDG